MDNDQYRANCIYSSQFESYMITRRRYNIAEFARRQYHRNYALLTRSQARMQ
ncbi:hypothetical protein PA598K_01461 [Paenibacillus sp. 598K]|uniref:hypothetical protein n=1 Tax=Paenibacillus sp. 598K TaxID=1117987 RepID=UPI000FF9CCE1|nr:hypothetical protein [Paenibacillus sp. 598K]GBF73176.1 hypothetical protein PA598K_01461 [Paenibacillus sp. 598K]